VDILNFISPLRIRLHCLERKSGNSTGHNLILIVSCKSLPNRGTKNSCSTAGGVGTPHIDRRW